MSELQIQPIPGKTFGAYVTGKHIASFVDLDWDRLYSAFNEHGILVFAVQYLSGKMQPDFCARFGAGYESLVPASPQMRCVPIGNCTGKEMFQLINSDSDHTSISAAAELITDPVVQQTVVQNDYWHVDSTYMPVAAKAGSLNAVEVPSGGGETMFVDAAAAYDALPAEQQLQLEGLRAYHSFHYSTMQDQGRDVQVGKAYGYNGDAFLYSIVKTHPETGRKSIYTGRHAFHVGGWGRDESRALIKRLNEHIPADPNREYAHQYSPGDFIIWDNRRLLHKAMPFDLKQRRLLIALRITGDGSEESLPAPQSKAVLEAEMAILRKTMHGGPQELAKL